MSSRVDDAALKDVNRTLEYSYLHRTAINMLPIGLLVCLFGFFFLAPLDGSEPSDKARPLLAVVFGLVLAVGALLALRREDKPALSLSVDGIACWPISEQPIPWHEIRGVETERFCARRAIFARTVSVILVSKDFYERINGSYFGFTDYVAKGDPVRIRILHFDYSAPFQELHDAIIARWQAFGRPQVTELARGATVPRVRATTLRDTARKALAAVTPSRPDISPWRFWLSVTPLLAIIVLLANLVGLWSTQAQRDARHARALEAERWAESRRLSEEVDQRSRQLSKDMEKSFSRLHTQMQQIAEPERQQQRAATQPQPVQEGGHREAVLALAVTPDGRGFVSAGGDRALKFWELARPAAPRNLGAHRSIVRSVHVIDDGAHALSAGDDGDIVLRALSDGRTVQVFREPGRGDVAALAVSGDGRRAVSVYDKGGGDVWSLSGRIRLQVLDSGGMRLQSVAISPDGRRALGGGADGILRLWDMDSGNLLRSFGISQGPLIYGVAFLPDGKRAVSAGGDAALRLWDVDTGAEIRSLTGHTNTVYSVAVSSDGKRLVSGSIDRTARLWDADTGSEIARLSGHEGPVYSVAFTRDGILTGSGDRSIRLWNATGGDPVRVFAGGERLDR